MTHFNIKIACNKCGDFDNGGAATCKACYDKLQEKLAAETAAREAAEALADRLRQTVFDLIGSQQLGEARYKEALERATQTVLEAERALFGDAALSAGRAQTGGEGDNDE